MIEYILLASIAAVILLLLMLRTNSAICFLALCAGSVLLASSGVNVGLVASSLTSGLSTSTNFAQILLLVIPLIVTAFMLKGQINKSMLPMAFIPATCVALLTAIFTVPLLPDGTEHNIINTETWEILIQYQEFIVGVGLVVSIVMIAITVSKPHSKHKKGKH